MQNERVESRRGGVNSRRSESPRKQEFLRRIDEVKHELALEGKQMQGLQRDISQERRKQSDKLTAGQRVA